MTTTAGNNPRLLGTPNPVTVFDPNSYRPVYMPEQSIYLVEAGGLQDWVKSVNKCLAFENVDDLVSALQALGYTYTAKFEDPPYEVPGGNTFAGGPKGNGDVPWIGISPVPAPPWQAGQGAFVVNAGVYGYFWKDAAVVPFVGSSFHLDLIADIEMRIQAARNGQPNLGLAVRKTAAADKN